MKALWRSLKQSKTGMIGLAIVLVVVVCAIFAYQLAPCDPLQQDLMNKLHDPAWTATGTPEHLLGTDQLGRDVLSRLLVGARITLLVALAGTVVGGVVGVVLGCLAGYYGGWVDAVLMRLVDIQLCFPFTLLALFIADWCAVRFWASKSVNTLKPSVRKAAAMPGSFSGISCPMSSAR